jgi:hypothetical protein
VAHSHDEPHCREGGKSCAIWKSNAADKEEDVWSEKGGKSSVIIPDIAKDYGADSGAQKEHGLSGGWPDADNMEWTKINTYLSKGTLPVFSTYPVHLEKDITHYTFVQVCKTFTITCLSNDTTKQSFRVIVPSILTWEQLYFIFVISGVVIRETFPVIVFCQVVCGFQQGARTNCTGVRWCVEKEYWGVDCVGHDEGKRETDKEKDYLVEKGGIYIATMYVVRPLFASSRLIELHVQYLTKLN